MSPETLISMIAAKGLEFGYVPGGGRPEWTSQDAALACRDLPPRMYAALCFTYAGDQSQFWTLTRELRMWADWQARRSGSAWSDDAFARIYDLVEMWLLEVRQPWRFVRHENAPTPDLRRVIIGVHKDKWRRDFSPAYEAIREEFTTWLSIGAGRMRKWLRDDVSVCAND